MVVKIANAIDQSIVDTLAAVIVVTDVDLIIYWMLQGLHSAGDKVIFPDSGHTGVILTTSQDTWLIQLEGT